MAAVLTSEVGVAALSGRVSYPYAVELGPIHASWRMTLPVPGSGKVGQRRARAVPAVEVVRHGAALEAEARTTADVIETYLDRLLLEQT